MLWMSCVDYLLIIFGLLFFIDLRLGCLMEGIEEEVIRFKSDRWMWMGSESRVKKWYLVKKKVVYMD